VRVTKGLKFGIVEFAAIVTLNCLKGEVKLCGDISMEDKECSIDIRFLAGEAPKIMSEIIHYD
jgi:hypothetical protein